jgi:uncharacterized protein YjbI with pentapeptide repeats
MYKIYWAIITTIFSLVTVPVYAANPAYIQQLLKTKKCVKCDLSGAELLGVNLSEAELLGAHLSKLIFH